MICKHCGKTIRRYYSDLSPWVHEDGFTWCRLTYAEPAEQTNGGKS